MQLVTLVAICDVFNCISLINFLIFKMYLTNSKHQESNHLKTFSFFFHSIFFAFISRLTFSYLETVKSFEDEGSKGAERLMKV